MFHHCHPRHQLTPRQTRFSSIGYRLRPYRSSNGVSRPRFPLDPRRSIRVSTTPASGASLAFTCRSSLRARPAPRRPPKRGSWVRRRQKAPMRCAAGASGLGREAGSCEGGKQGAMRLKALGGAKMRRAAPARARFLRSSRCALLHSGPQNRTRAISHPCHGRWQLADPRGELGPGRELAYPRGRAVNPSFPSILTAPAFPPSKSPQARRWPVANSYAVPKIAFGG